jgi:hypothetical protein
MTSLFSPPLSLVLLTRKIFHFLLVNQITTHWYWYSSVTWRGINWKKVAASQTIFWHFLLIISHTRNQPPTPFEKYFVPFSDMKWELWNVDWTTFRSTYRSRRICCTATTIMGKSIFHRALWPTLRTSVFHWVRWPVSAYRETVHTEMSELTGTFVAQIANSLGAFQSIWKKAGNLNSLRNGNCQIIQGNIIKLHCLHHKMSIVFKDMSREIREKLNDFTLAGSTGTIKKKITF